MIRRALVLGLLGALAAACGASDASEPLPLEPQPLRSEAQVAYEEIEGATAVVSGIPDRRRLVIGDAETWAAFWTELHANLSPVPDLPTVDFSTRIVVAATMGRRPTGGYAIRIEAVSRRGDDFEVVVVESSPAAGCLTTQAITAPATAVSVTLTAGGVEFVERTETADCS